MRIRRIKLLLWSTVIVFAGATALIVVRTSKLADRIRAIQAPKPMTLDSIETPSVELPPVAELQARCQRDLRQSLYDPPPPPPAAPAPPPPAVPPPLTLTGTVMEPGRCRAMLLGADGKLQFRKIGDQADGAVLLNISRDSVTLQYQGREVVLKIEKKG